MGGGGLIHADAQVVCQLRSSEGIHRLVSVLIAEQFVQRDVGEAVKGEWVGVVVRRLGWVGAVEGGGEGGRRPTLSEPPPIILDTDGSGYHLWILLVALPESEAGRHQRAQQSRFAAAGCCGRRRGRHRYLPDVFAQLLHGEESV